jgi:trk system potassium uptake protein TrkA
MFVIVVGGGKVGYFLARELIGSGHEVALMERDRARATQITEEIGSIVIAHDGCEGKYLGQAGANRADIVAAVTGDDEDNLVICQMAKHHFDVPRTIARVNNPKNESLFKHLGVDEIVSPTRMILGSIEELVEAQLQEGSPVVGHTAGSLELPDGCSIFAVIRDERAISVRSDTELRQGDKVIGIGRTECEAELHRILLGETDNSH